MRGTTIAIITGVLFCLAAYLIQIHGAAPAGSVYLNSQPLDLEIAENPVEGPRQRTDAGIDVNSPPHLVVDKSVSIDEIWQKDDERGPKNATVNLEISGAGNPAIDFNSQDVVFTVDSSTSMNDADTDFLRLEAAKNYTEHLLAPDRAAVVRFYGNAELVGGHHLSSDYDRVMSDLSDWDNQDGTNFNAAIQLMNAEFLNYGEENKSWVCILLTDGKPEPLSTNITTDVLNETIALNITIHTIGLYQDRSSSLVDEELLKWIANMTGGEYFIAKTANDLQPIYENIAMRFRNYTAGYDPDVNDSEPMIRDVLYNDFYIDQNSFTRYPDAMYGTEDNLTVMEWNISKVSIGDKILISYNISSNLIDSNVSLHPPNSARVVYNVRDDEHQEFFSTVTLTIKSSKPPLEWMIPPSPPPMPGPPPPPPPPPGGSPVVVINPAPPTVIPLSAPTGLPAAATPVVFPVEYFIAGFVGLGIIERLKLKKRLISRQKVAVGT